VRITLVLCVASIAACGSKGANTPRPKSVITETLPVDQLYLLEAGGVPPADTSVTFKTGEQRTVIMRHPAPDNGVFAELIFPEDVFPKGGPEDSVTVQASVRPGLYGLDISSTVEADKPGIVRFKYPVHFSAPQGALAKYGSAVRYELLLQIARQIEDGRYALYRSTRRASDNLEAPMVLPGRFVVGAPR
jgi:hypothetical protein